MQLVTNTSLRTFLCALGAAAMLGCGGGGTDTDSSNRTIEGRVDDGQPAAAADGNGTLVTASRLEADGSLTVVSSGSVEVDASGRYSLALDSSVETASDLVVTAERDGSEVGRVVFRASFDGEGSATAPPIDAGGTVITDVYIDARASGRVDAEVPPAYARLLIDAELAAALDAEASRSAAIEAASIAFGAAVEAWEQSLTHAAIGVGEADLSMAHELSAEAGAELSAALDGASTAAEQEAAIEAYVDAMMQAYADAGVQADELAAGIVAASEAMVTYGVMLSDDARAQLIGCAASLRAELMARATATVEVTGSTAATAMAEAEASLHASIEAAVEAGGEIEATIEEAFATYRDAVIAAIGSSVEASAQAYAQAVAEVAAATDGLDEAWASLTGSLTFESAGSIAADGIGDFMASATASANVELLTSAGMSSADAELLLRVVALLHASAM